MSAGQMALRRTLEAQLAKLFSGGHAGKDVKKQSRFFHTKSAHVLVFSRNVLQKGHLVFATCYLEANPLEFEF